MVGGTTKTEGDKLRGDALLTATSYYYVLASAGLHSETLFPLTI